MKKSILIIFVLTVFALTGCTDTVKNSPDFISCFDEVFGGEWTTPGLVTADGEEYILPEANETTGQRLNVLDFGAKANDEAFDNTESFQAAIDAAAEGDEVYVPAGEYYFVSPTVFSTDYVAHISLKSKVNFIGEGRDETILVSNFEPEMNENYKTTVILSKTQSDIVISDMTITSNTDDDVLPDPDISNLNTFVETSPVYGIVVDNGKPNQIHGNVVIQNVLIEKYQRMGVRIRWVRDVRVLSCVFQNATDLGGGGAGYGISIQGMSNGADLTDSNIDPIYNVVKDCEINGPYIRHGIILQYYAHNNLITGNTIKDTLLDAIDLHGEDEYSNEISYNTIINTRRGAGIGVGNSGATHDAAGPYNYIHNNTIIGGDRGIDVLYGSANTVIYNNVIKDIENIDATGLFIQNGHNAIVKDNTFENITGEEAIGVKVLYSYNALEPEIGIPNGIKIERNRFENVTNGVYTEAHTDDYTYIDNKYSDISGYEYIDENDAFITPEISDVVIPRKGDILYPTDDNFITNEFRTTIQSQSNMKFKASYADVPYNRMIYIKFDLSEAPSNRENVYLKFSAKSKDGLATINIHGTEEYVNWSENSITWENVEYHEDQVAVVLDTNSELTHVIDFTFVTVGTEFNTYYVDITDYVKSLNKKVFTLILSNDAVENMYCEIYSKETSSDDNKLALLFSND